MIRYPLLAAAALVALAAAAGPAAAKDPSAAGQARPAGDSPACAVPAAVDAPVLPPSPDSALEDKIEQLTSVIADLSDRLQTLEDELGDPDDADGGAIDDGLDLANARAARQPGWAAPPARARHGAQRAAAQNVRSRTLPPMPAL